MAQAERGSPRPAPWWKPDLHSVLAKRLAAAALGMPLIILAVLAGPETTAALIALAAVVATAELMLAFGQTPRDAAPWLAAAGVGALIGAAASREIPLFWPATAAMLGIACGVTVQATLRESRPEPAVLRPYLAGAGIGLGALLYLALPGATFVLLRAVADGTEWLLLALLVVMTADTGAYVGGRTLGRRPLAPAISPHKTLEGGIAGWIAGFGATLALAAILGLDVAIWKMALLGLVLPVLSQLGDLAESLIKRAAGIKDSSHLIPGHGGVLDRLDSLLVGVPTVYFFVLWIAT